MSSLTDETITPLAVQLVECLQAALNETPSPPGRPVMLRTGVSVSLLLSRIEDECCDGLGWVRVDRIYPTTNFPVVAELPWPGFGDVGQRAAVLEMGVARCAPRPGADEIPTEDQWNDLSAAVMDDAAAMRRAICCWAELNPGTSRKQRMYVEGTWLPLPTNGGCAGGTLPLIVALPNCDC